MPRDWWKRGLDAGRLPDIRVPPPGPRSKELHGRIAGAFKGLSSQVRLFPVAFEKGFGATLTDADGNTYLDFSSGIYVTGLGHCHPKVSEAVARYARTLMNCHDFTTEVKVRLVEKLLSMLPGDFGGVQLYDSGTVAVEAGLRAVRAATGKWEFFSGFSDFHGKTFGAVSLARTNAFFGPTRAPGFHMVPRSYPYRPAFRKEDGCEDLDAYFRFYEQYLVEATAGKAAGFVLEPIQGWAGSVIPHPDYLRRVREFCDRHGMLLMADEVLTCCGRAGAMLACERLGVVPDVVTLGKGFGNGFPVTAMCVRKPFADGIDRISASSSYGGNPMACAAALASLEVIEEEGILENVMRLEKFFLERMRRMAAEHPIIGEARGMGCLLGIELVKDRATKEPFEEAGKLVYQKAFRKGLAWIPAGHILRMSPPLIIDEKLAAKGMDIIDEAIGETEKELGCSR